MEIPNFTQIFELIVLLFCSGIVLTLFTFLAILLWSMWQVVKDEKEKEKIK